MCETHRHSGSTASATLPSRKPTRGSAAVLEVEADSQPPTPDLSQARLTPPPVRPAPKLPPPPQSKRAPVPEPKIVRTEPPKARVVPPPPAPAAPKPAAPAPAAKPTPTVPVDPEVRAKRARVSTVLQRAVMEQPRCSRMSLKEREAWEDKVMLQVHDGLFGNAPDYDAHTLREIGNRVRAELVSLFGEERRNLRLPNFMDDGRSGFKPR